MSSSPDAVSHQLFNTFVEEHKRGLSQAILLIIYSWV